MTRPASFVVAAACAALAVGALAHEVARVETRQAMIDGINPAALAIWEVTNAAMNDEGGLDPALIDDNAWVGLREAAELMQFHSERMAHAEAIVAGGPDLPSGEIPPGVSSKEQIQGMIDADPDGFRASATDLAAQAGRLAQAARERNATLAGELATQIDTTCQSCHERYWYPPIEAQAVDPTG